MWKLLPTRQKQEIAERFKADKIQPVLPDLLTSYNVAPTTYQPVIRHSRDGAARKLLLMCWGLVPYFAKSLADFKGVSTFNAKAESVHKANTWREPLIKGRRCLVPADDSTKWKVLESEAKKPTKQPYAFTVPDQPVFAFAGLWDWWRDPHADAWLQSFAIITTTPNELTGQVHNRMPVILHERDWDEWLLRERPAPSHLLKPFPAAEMAMRAAGKDVGNVRNDHPEWLNS